MMTAGHSAECSNSPCGIHSLPDEIIAKILSSASTPTFLQLLRTNKGLFFRVAQNNRRVLLHHLNAIPGDKELLTEQDLSNEQLCLLLRQRAANHLFGANFSANMTEYTNRNARPDAQLSAISGLDADYVRMALTFENTNDIRQYTSHCQIKEKLEQRQDGRMIKLVQWSRIVSALHAVSDPIEEGCTDALPSDTSGSETDMPYDRPFVSSTNLRLVQSQQEAAKSLRKKKKRGRKDTARRISKYKVTHFDIYTMEDSRTYFVLPPEGYVPRDFVVQTFTQFAILWDRPRSNNRPSEHAKVILYTVRPIENESIIETETRVVWPKAKPNTTDADSDSDEAPENLPKTISFFKDGRRIKMYEAGSVVPYQVFSTSTTQHDPYGPTNVINFTEFSFHVDTPFFGKHITFEEGPSHPSFCCTSYLCLGVTTLDVGVGDNEDEVRVLCILKSLTTAPYDACDHQVSLSRLPHLGAHNTTVVARLWGWEEVHTSLSGKDVVAVSPGGTRIAIAMWNKVYIYPLNPKILCEENVVEGSDNEGSKQKKKKKKSKRPWNISTSSYYKRYKDSNLMDWKVAVLRPIILDLEGAIAQKMSWSPAKGKITDTMDPEPSDEEFKEVAEREVLPIFDTNQIVDDEHGVHSALANVSVPSESAPIEDQPSPGAQPPLSEQVAGFSEPTIETAPTPVTVENDIEHDGTVLQGGPISPPTETENENTEVQSNQQAPNVDQQPPATPTEPVSTQNIPLDLGIQDGEPETSVQLNGETPTEVISTTNSCSATLSSPPTLGESNAPLKPKILARKDKTCSTSHIDHSPSKQISPYLQHSSKPQSDIQLSQVSNKSPLIKPKQTGSDSVNIATNNSTVTPTLGHSGLSHYLQNASVPTTSNAGPSEQHTEPPVGNGTVCSDSQMEATSKTKDLNGEAEISANLSKTLQSSNSNAQTAGETSNETEPVSTESLLAGTETKSELARRKRVTEDELIILTDRGVQIWNIGANAKGLRRNKNLPLEESLAGRLPVRSNKQKEI